MKRATEANLNLLTPTSTPPLTGGATGRKHRRPVVSGSGDYPIRIGEYRKRAGMTQAALARKLGITREHLSRIEGGRVFLTEMVERRIARHLNLSNEDQLIAFGYPTRLSSANRRDIGGAEGAAAPIDLDARRLSRVAR